MNKAEYKNEIYNIETIYVYDELISIYKGNLLESNSIKVKLSEVKIISLCGALGQGEQLDCDHDWEFYSFDCYGMPYEKYCEHCGKKEPI